MIGGLIEAAASPILGSWTELGVLILLGLVLWGGFRLGSGVSQKITEALKDNAAEHSTLAEAQGKNLKDVKELKDRMDAAERDRASHLERRSREQEELRGAIKALERRMETQEEKSERVLHELRAMTGGIGELKGMLSRGG